MKQFDTDFKCKVKLNAKYLINWTLDLKKNIDLQKAVRASKNEMLSIVFCRNTGQISTKLCLMYFV